MAFFFTFFHFFFVNFLSRFLHTFSILPTTVGDVAGLVLRDVGESDVVIRLVIPGWRRVGKSSL